MLDVLVIGGGNAALCAALMAREAGASVLMLEAAPREWRGGNSQHTRNLRCMHDEPQDVLVEAYPEEEYWQDLLKVTGGLTEEKLARLVIRASSSCRPWSGRLTFGRYNSAPCPSRWPSYAGARRRWWSGWSMPPSAATAIWRCTACCSTQWSATSAAPEPSSMTT